MDTVHNVSRKEREALYALRKNENIVITKTDKGDATIIINTSHLISLVYKHLADQKTYQLLEIDPTPEVVTTFNRYLRDCASKKGNYKQQFNQLYPPENTSTQTMYFLPKRLKTPLKIRPIISCTNGPTCTASIVRSTHVPVVPPSYKLCFL